MAASVPASLRSSGIVPFARRAQQTEKAKPAVAYWCNYWIAQQILGKGLHNNDEESKTYVTDLMDRLETAKTEHPDEDAILDEVAAKAYLEKFGLEVFNRGTVAMRSDKASGQTSDTFQAAATFLELLKIWQPLDPEIAKKIVYAKYHAARIGNALKAGEDPNLTNPSREPTPGQETVPLDPNDPEVLALGGIASPQDGRQPSIEEVQDEHDQISPSMARASSLDESLHPSRAPSTVATGLGPSIPPSQSAAVDTNVENYYHRPDGGDVSPLAPSAPEDANPEEKGYFPHVLQEPTGASVPSTLQSPTSAHNAAPVNVFGIPSAPPPISPVHPSPTSVFPRETAYAPQQAPTQKSGLVPENQQNPFAGAPNQSLNPSHTQPPSWSPGQVPTRSQQPHLMVQEESYIADEEAISKAQKHARWAISALNFEDVKTAVDELRDALKTLGAR